MSIGQMIDFVFQCCRTQNIALSASGTKTLTSQGTAALFVDQGLDFIHNVLMKIVRLPELTLVKCVEDLSLLCQVRSSQSPR